ncbi:MAG: hypothetical protein R2742_03570 [Micropruina glycogenica]
MPGDNCELHRPNIRIDHSEWGWIGTFNRSSLRPESRHGTGLRSDFLAEATERGAGGGLTIGQGAALTIGAAAGLAWITLPALAADLAGPASLPAWLARRAPAAAGRHLHALGCHPTGVSLTSLASGCGGAARHSRLVLLCRQQAI